MYFCEARGGGLGTTDRGRAPGYTLRWGFLLERGAGLGTTDRGRDQGYTQGQIKMSHACARQIERRAAVGPEPGVRSACAQASLRDFCNLFLAKVGLGPSRASVGHDSGVCSAQRARRPRCEISAIYFWQKLVFAPIGPWSDMIPECAHLAQRSASAQRALRSACAHAVGPQSDLSLECAQHDPCRRAHMPSGLSQT